MKQRLIGMALAAAFAMPLATGIAHAKATPEEIARLGKDLTCIGAEKAGKSCTKGKTHNRSLVYPDR